MTLAMISVLVLTAAIILSGDVFAVLPGVLADFATDGAARAAGLVRRSTGGW